ncbi:DUF4400 domain-containing protein [Methylococcus capsulatus]|uniref:DUF4400 domain-containing protein n=1 Tax=Methylococcus capsulatus TaxID=414 RepID=UPI001C527FF0|nr:DUF4400 domain-containing protein [Methylococcus capsulatus]QXP89472.1 DUF4400 domain-containing protein [Methylococcus capsulatus]
MIRHLLAWILIVFATPIFIAAFVAPSRMSAWVRQDWIAAAAFLPPERLKSDIDRGYRSVLRAIGEASGEFQHRNDDSDLYRTKGDPVVGQKMADLPGNWSQAVRISAYSLALRCAILAYWLPWFGAAALFAVLAGHLERRLKFATFSSPSPPVYNGVLHGSLVIAGLVALWALSPIPLPLYWIPALLSAFLVCAARLAAHYPSAH